MHVYKILNLKSADTYVNHVYQLYHLLRIRAVAILLVNMIISMRGCLIFNTIANNIVIYLLIVR